MMPTLRWSGVRSRIITIVIFACAMGWFEAVVVAYLRLLLAIAPGQGYPPFANMMQRFEAYGTLLAIEQSRELATLIMLATLGVLSARTWPARVGGLLVAFGVWDLAYYAALTRLVTWPTGLGDIDLLFLVPPHPLWVQPVWVPASLALLMTLAGARLMSREPRQGPTG